jgi:hypothetical protein
MKIKLYLPVLILFTLSSCQKKESSFEQTPLIIQPQPDAKSEFKSLNSVLEQYDTSMQIFTVSGKQPTTVKGKNGTEILVEPIHLMMVNGEALGDKIVVELKELINQEHLLRSNAQTISDGKLLVSGGAYYINFTSNGQQIQLKEGKSVSVSFPKLTSKEMQLFYGERDTFGQMNWQLAGQSFESRTKPVVAKDSVLNVSVNSSDEINDLLAYIEKEPTKPLTQKEKKAIKEQKENFDLTNKLYQSVELKQLGWINCDRFYDVKNRTNLHYAFTEKDSFTCVNVYLVFKDMNSLMQDSYFKSDDNYFYRGFLNIPTGAKTKLIAFSVKNGKTYTYQSDVIITPDATIELTLEETNTEDLAKFFQLE